MRQHRLELRPQQPHHIRIDSHTTLSPPDYKMQRLFIGVS
jgi:hypothetical protein